MGCWCGVLRGDQSGGDLFRLCYHPSYSSLLLDDTAHHGPTRHNNMKSSTPRNTPDRQITPLTRPTSAKIRSSLIIPTYPSVLSELLHNSLDAHATRVSVHIDLTAGSEKVRVEDDGWGIGPRDLRRVGGRYETSKVVSSSGMSSVGSFGFRGEALSSIAALGLMDITTRAKGSRRTLSKVIKGSEVLYEGPSPRTIAGPHGTTVLVKDLFHSIPVRQHALARASPQTTLTACKKVVEALALVRPGVAFDMWDGSVGPSTGARKVLSVEGAPTMVESFRLIYGTASVERVQNIRVTAGQRRVQGFISLSGLLHKNHQHLYINSYPVERGDIHHAISTRFNQSRFSAFTQEDDRDTTQYNRKSPRRLERHPVYVLNLILPAEEVDSTRNPRKTVMGHKNIDEVKALALAVIDEFLKRHGFAEGKHAQPTPPRRAAHTGEVTPTESPLQRHGFGRSPMTPRAMAERGGRHSGPSVVSPVNLSLRKEVRGAPQADMRNGKRPREALDDEEEPITPKRSRPAENVTDYGQVASNGSMEWLEELISRSRARSRQSHRSGWTPQPEFTPEERFSPGRSMSHEAQDRLDDDIACRHDTAVILPQGFHPLADIKLSRGDLDTIKVLRQVDRKFIACTMVSDPSAEKPSEKVLAVIDQHAADERVAIERILEELCRGFIDDDVPITTLDTPVAVVLSKAEGTMIVDVLDIFRRWGIHLEPAKGEGEYLQVAATAVPTALLGRLGRKKGEELERLIKLYLPRLEASGGELRAMLATCETPTGQSGPTDTVRALMWMPQEMVELANSKACRGAVMFGDKLDREQCERLVDRLKQTRTPFICAHGRPSLVPLCVMVPAETGRREIDWVKWKARGDKGGSPRGD
ncbi:hypothetical protein DB88DRAFT_483462 [Papiliotrema laurentii]|uniref:MutL C-terminal dimerisation domain-containing protein n=1 Tax=Papiliotrema laurentii TaxID=5418 RepID=A0AAD9L6R2_PAPLA|nr:hypothetical protein DB88DRAFT_483462 [Papiliotrema laurentii]